MYVNTQSFIRSDNGIIIFSLMNSIEDESENAWDFQTGVDPDDVHSFFIKLIGLPIEMQYRSTTSDVRVHNIYAF